MFRWQLRLCGPWGLSLSRYHLGRMAGNLDLSVWSVHIAWSSLDDWEEIEIRSPVTCQY
jgi:hypothetical protein